MKKTYIFDTIASIWWKKHNICQPLHIINNIRFNYIQSKTKINKKNIIDIGCGGGVLSEKLAAHGGIITGLDKSKNLIKIAKSHNKKNSSKIHYINKDINNFIKHNNNIFDIVICMELLEHVEKKADLIKIIDTLCKKHGIIIISSLKKNILTYIYMILICEYITKDMKINMHTYENLLDCTLIKKKLNDYNMHIIDIKGIIYNPILKYSHIGTSTNINYIITLQKI